MIRRYNYYDFGGGLKEGLGSFKFDATSLGKSIGSNIGGIASAAGGVVGNLIGGGYESGVGKALGVVGDIGGMVPGPWGAAIGAGAKVLGGVVNAAFGTKVDQRKLNAANQGTNYLNSFTSTATSFDDVKGPNAVVSVGQVYKGGWFSGGKARRKNEELRRERRAAESYANRSVDNNIANISKTQADNLAANFAAFGGPLDFGFMPVGGAIDYELAQKRLQIMDNRNRDKNPTPIYALGGPLQSNGADWTNGIIIVGNGGTHEQNPLEGVQMGVAPDGTPNLVEEGEVIFDDYVFSDRIKVPKSVKEKLKLRGKDGMTFADAAKKAQKESEERPNDPISARSLEDIMSKLMVEQESIRQKKASKGGNRFAEGGLFSSPSSFFGVKSLSAPSVSLPGTLKYKVMPELKLTTSFEPKLTTGKSMLNMTPSEFFNLSTGTTRSSSRSGSNDDNSQDQESNNPLKALRFVPAFGGAVGVITDLLGLTNTPDYSHADSIVNAANIHAGSIPDVRFKPIGNYLAYTPLDRLFYANQLGAHAAGVRRNILNTSGGNRATAIAGLLGADFNAQTQLGNLFRQAEEYNLGQRERVENFNRATNEFNSEGFLKAAMANAENGQKKASILVSAAEKAAALKQAADDRVGAARSANLTNLFDSLGDIGREAFAMDMIKNNRGLLYDWMGRYKGKLLDDADGKPKACGGFLTIKKRRRK